MEQEVINSFMENGPWMTISIALVCGVIFYIIASLKNHFATRSKNGNYSKHEMLLKALEVRIQKLENKHTDLYRKIEEILKSHHQLEITLLKEMTKIKTIVEVKNGR